MATELVLKKYTLMLRVPLLLTPISLCSMFNIALVIIQPVLPILLLPIPILVRAVLDFEIS